MGRPRKARTTGLTMELERIERAGLTVPTRPLNWENFEAGGTATSAENFNAMQDALIAQMVGLATEAVEEATSAQGAHAKEYNVVSEFGADNTGATDTTAKEQEAVDFILANGGGCLYYPPGTYKRTGAPVAITCNNVKIRIAGAGAGLSIFSLSGEAIQAFVQTGAEGETGGNIEISGFGFNGNNVEASLAEVTTPPIIFGINSTAVSVKHLHIHHCRTFNVPRQSSPAKGRANIRVAPTMTTLAQAITIEDVEIDHLELLGGNQGIEVGVGGSKYLPFNAYHANIHVHDILHLIAGEPVAISNDIHVQVGSKGWGQGENIVIERVWGRNSGEIGVALFIAGTVRDCIVENYFNSGFQALTTNCATTKAPVAAELTAVVKPAATLIPVASAAFKVGDRIVIYANKKTEANKNDVLTIQAIPDGAHIEVSTPVIQEHLVGAGVQRVDNMHVQRMIFEDCHAIQNLTATASGSAFQIQNYLTCLPIGAVSFIRPTYSRGTPSPGHSGEFIVVQGGTEVTPWGGPAALEVTGAVCNIAGEYTEAATLTEGPFYVQSYGPLFPLSFDGEISLALNSTGGAKVTPRLMYINHASCVLDIKLRAKFEIANTGGEQMSCIQLGPSSQTTDISGHIQITIFPSIGGSAPIGVLLGNPGVFASSETGVAVKEEIAAGTTVLPVTGSTAQFFKGQAIVLGSAETTGEVFIISAVAAESITIVSAGETPGTVNVHAAGSLIAPLRTIVIENSDFTGLGSSGKPISSKPGVLARVRTKNNTYGVLKNPTVLALPASGKALQLLTGESMICSIAGGEVSAVEWSPDGSNWLLIGSFTGVSFPVFTGDFIRVTSTGAPTAKLFPVRD